MSALGLSTVEEWSTVSFRIRGNVTDGRRELQSDGPRSPRGADGLVVSCARSSGAVARGTPFDEPRPEPARTVTRPSRVRTMRPNRTLSVSAEPRLDLSRSGIQAAETVPTRSPRLFSSG